MQKDESQKVEEYISGFPSNVKTILQKIRSIIKKAAPNAIETINYGIPTFKQHGNLVHYGAYKNHIGFYATPKGNQAFEEELSKYKKGKGSIQFPLSEPIPYKLIEQMVLIRVKQNLEKVVHKKK